ncbi:hypothetical protein K9M06_02890 [Candidatus Bipolaricaulota bacterium]|nr:hypothetical protein [Candidatus Bipolaricaulota bacterium]
MSKDPKKELKDTMDKQIVMSKNLDKALEFHTKMNPIDTVLKPLEGREEFRDQQSKVESMVNTWIDTYMAMLEEGDELPVDLIGRASEIARDLREEGEEEEL